MAYISIGCEINILHGELKKKKQISINKPPSYVMFRNEQKVHKLKKTLNELKISFTDLI